ncbi:MAG: MFS transporter [Dehalococcoidales bacterium]|nr:MFS transporter [Dehalococcoidales bacterium]
MATDIPGHNFRRIDYVKVTILGLALSALWGSLHSIVLPMRLLDFVSATQKNTYLGFLTLTGLLLAMLVQPVSGAISDRASSRMGRRRPFILFGIIITVALLPGISLADSYAVLFAVYCLMQISANTAQGPYQALIPDLVPKEKHGVASGVKGLFEILGGFGLVYLIVYFADRYLSTRNGLSLLPVSVVLAVLLLVTLLIVIYTVSEQPLPTRHSVPLFATWRQSRGLKLRQNAPFLYFLVSRLLFIMALTTMQSFALYYLQDVIQVADTASATAGLLALVGAGMVGAVYPAGHLSDRLGRKLMLVVSGSVGASGILILLITTNYSYVLIGGALIGISGGIFLSSSWALAIDLLPRNEEAAYLGLTNLATAGGAAMARLIGPIIDLFNTRSWGLGYQIMLGSCLAYFIIGVLLILKIKTVRRLEVES